ncbi:hypothetical protein BJP36_43940 [Moorena producens JHB]|uniref:Uncharacterized protein n=1 Tax=Moorena producens (strain JHB) TaxID=1454205 RepID=A0A9Q9STF7_MOOP1|nr:hypothetical protein [Moorena producens]WAN69312.1 hypothetical protein BJP36_43940 [Moorena producens JHB]
MRYTGFFPYCLLPIAYCLLPITCSLLPKTQKFVAHLIKNCYSNFSSLLSVTEGKLQTH